MVEKITKFKAADGNTYDTETDAILAEEKWKQHKTVELANRVNQLAAKGKGYIDTQIKRFKENPKLYPQLLVETAKHGDFYYLATTPLTRLDIYYSIFIANKNSGFYDIDDTSELVEEIAKYENKFAALQFVKSRSQCEYESVSIEPLIVL